MHKRSRDRQELFCVTGDALVGDANSNGRLGGATLAAPASRAGLIDEYRLFGAYYDSGGKRVLPGNVCVKLNILDERRFANGSSIFANTHGPGVDRGLRRCRPSSGLPRRAFFAAFPAPS